jgi:hypothetical protein
VLKVACAAAADATDSVDPLGTQQQAAVDWVLSLCGVILEHQSNIYYL